MSTGILLLTPGRCGSSLVMRMLEVMGCRVPRGESDSHPWGTNFEDPVQARAQIEGDFAEWFRSVRDYASYPCWAVKLQTGVLWGRHRVLSGLRAPRIVKLTREQPRDPQYEVEWQNAAVHWGRADFEITFEVVVKDSIAVAWALAGLIELEDRRARLLVPLAVAEVRPELKHQ